MSDQIKYLLDEEKIPKSWYNIQADLPEPAPPVLNPGTQQPIGPAAPALEDQHHHAAQQPLFRTGQPSGPGLRGALRPCRAMGGQWAAPAP